jgi:molybdate transport system substrate-binding protein
MLRSIIAGALSMLALSGSPCSADAAQLTIFTSRALGTVLEEAGPEYERSSGHKLNVVVDLSPTFVRRINAVDDFDVLITPPPVIDSLIAAGKLVGDTRTTLVRAATGVAVRAGAPKPDISSVEALKNALRNARSVGYLPTGGVAPMIERLGLTEVVARKATVPDSDVVSY